MNENMNNRIDGALERAVASPDPRRIDAVCERAARMVSRSRRLKWSGAATVVGLVALGVAMVPRPSHARSLEAILGDDLGELFVRIEHRRVNLRSPQRDTQLVTYKMGKRQRTTTKWSDFEMTDQYIRRHHLVYGYVETAPMEDATRPFRLLPSEYFEKDSLGRLSLKGAKVHESKAVLDGKPVRKFEVTARFRSGGQLATIERILIVDQANDRPISFEEWRAGRTQGDLYRYSYPPADTDRLTIKAPEGTPSYDVKSLAKELRRQVAENEPVKLRSSVGAIEVRAVMVGEHGDVAVFWTGIPGPGLSDEFPVHPIDNADYRISGATSLIKSSSSGQEITPRVLDGRRVFVAVAYPTGKRGMTTATRFRLPVFEPRNEPKRNDMRFVEYVEFEWKTPLKVSQSTSVIWAL